MKILITIGMSVAIILAAGVGMVLGAIFGLVAGPAKLLELVSSDPELTEETNDTI